MNCSLLARSLFKGGGYSVYSIFLDNIALKLHNPSFLNTSVLLKPSFVKFNLNSPYSSRTLPNQFRLRRSTDETQLSQNFKQSLLVTNRTKTQANNQNRLNSNVESKSQIPAAPPSNSIFKRFKEAYKQHGKILIWCHVVTCCGWITGLFVLAKSGFDITSLFNLLEKLHIMSHETSMSIEEKINTFDLEKFLKNYYFDYVLPDSAIKWLGQAITGTTLKQILTAIMLYKLVTPFRYLLTLTLTNVIIKGFKRRGLMPAHPPAGSSIPELIKEQQNVVSQNLRRQRESYRIYKIKQQNNMQNRFSLFKKNRSRSGGGKSL